MAVVRRKHLAVDPGPALVGGERAGLSGAPLRCPDPFPAPPLPLRYPHGVARQHPVRACIELQHVWSRSRAANAERMKDIRLREMVKIVSSQNLFFYGHKSGRFIYCLTTKHRFTTRHACFTTQPRDPYYELRRATYDNFIINRRSRFSVGHLFEIHNRLCSSWCVSRTIFSRYLLKDFMLAAVQIDTVCAQTGQHLVCLQYVHVPGVIVI